MWRMRVGASLPDGGLGGWAKQGRDEEVGTGSEHTVAACAVPRRECSQRQCDHCARCQAGASRVGAAA